MWYLFSYQRNFDETCHEYSSWLLEELKSFQGQTSSWESTLHLSLSFFWTPWFNQCMCADCMSSLTCCHCGLLMKILANLVNSDEFCGGGIINKSSLIPVFGCCSNYWTIMLFSHVTVGLCVTANEFIAENFLLKTASLTYFLQVVLNMVDIVECFVLRGQ